jgi:hypothetical protein
VSWGLQSRRVIHWAHYMCRTGLLHLEIISTQLILNYFCTETAAGVRVYYEMSVGNNDIPAIEYQLCYGLTCRSCGGSGW